MSVECYKTYLSYCNPYLCQYIGFVFQKGRLRNDAPLIIINGSDNKPIIQFNLLVASLLSAHTHFMIMKKPNKTASDLTACMIPTHAVMMHITKTRIENWKRKVIPEIFSTDNFEFISYIQLMSIHYQLMLILMVPSFLNFILHLRHI